MRTRFVEGAAPDSSLVAIAMGRLRCMAGGLFVRRAGGTRVAARMLAGWVLCGLAASWMLDAPLVLKVAWLLLGAAAVAGDSPQFSARTAQLAQRFMAGGLLSFVNAS